MIYRISSLFLFALPCNKTRHCLHSQWVVTVGGLLTWPDLQFQKMVSWISDKTAMTSLRRTPPFWQLTSVAAHACFACKEFYWASKTDKLLVKHLHKIEKGGRGGILCATNCVWIARFQTKLTTCNLQNSCILSFFIYGMHWNVDANVPCAEKKYYKQSSTGSLKPLTIWQERD